MSADAAEALASEILKCKAEDVPFDEGFGDVTRHLYLASPIGGPPATGGHLVGHQVVRSAVEGSRKALRGLLPQRAGRGGRCLLAKLEPTQIFATVYPPGKEFSCPWHVDQDTVLGSSIVLLRGTNEDSIMIQGAGARERKIALGAGEALVMAKNVAHKVPSRKRRKLTRVALVVWF